MAEGKVLIQDPRVGRPEELTVEQLDERWDGRLLLVATRAQMAALVKYRKLFGEVLIASFFLQLFGMISPLFFQVVTDKVLVHRALTSLDVLMIALIAVGLFEVVLGYYLFSHLLALPIAYHGARRVGDTVARVRELENIRSFLTGSALTLVMDLICCSPWCSSP